MKRFGHAIALTCLLLLPCRRAAGEWTADIVDMEWSPPRFVAVDKEAQSFSLLARQSPLRVLSAIPCATGQELGDKFKEGDLRTPEGVYFITRRKTLGLNFELYGDLAFPLNFPNPADVLRRKSGHGIWIHGRGHTIIPFETQGCVAMNTPDLHRMDPALAEGLPVVIADQIQIGGTDAAQVRSEAREIVEATQAWAKAWQDRSEAFFGFHDPEKFSITEGQPFAAFKSHKERLFKSLPWIRVTLSDVRAIAGPDYWVSYFVQVYRSPTLISQGIKRLYWQRSADGRFRIIGMEYEEMPVTMAEKGTAKTGQAAAPFEAETDTRKPDSPSEEEVQVRHMVDAHQAVMEKVAQKAFHAVTVKVQPTPEDQAILEVAETGASKPGVSPFASDAMKTVSPPPVVAPQVATPTKTETPAPVAAAAPTAGAETLAVTARAHEEAPVATVSAAAPPSSAPMPPASAHGQAPSEKKPASAVASAQAPVVAPERAAQIASLVEAWKAAWEQGRLDEYMAFYAEGARQGNLKGKEAIRRQKAGVWQGRAPGRVDVAVVAMAPASDGYTAVCSETYQGKGRRESKGYKTLSLVESGQKLLIARERWSRDLPAPVVPQAAAASSPPSSAPVAVTPAAPTREVAASPPPPEKKSPAKEDRTAAIAGLVEAWRSAWERGRLSDYAAFYADGAVQDTRRGREVIRRQKAGLWKNKAPKKIVFSDIKITPQGDGFTVSLVQDYEGQDGQSDRGRKTLRLAPAGNGYAIVDEAWGRM